MRRTTFAIVLVALLAMSSCSAARDLERRIAGPSASGSARKPSATSTSVVLPAGGYVVAVKGDWGAGTSAQRAITTQMCAVRKRFPFTDVVTVGDNFYAPDGQATARNFLKPEACLLAKGVRWRASWGNHDYGHPGTRTTLNTPAHWYRWTANDAEFFALDSNQRDSARQQAWLEDALRASSARVKIVYFHHPPYSAGGVHRPDLKIRSSWSPLFERYHVALVLNGHEHDYEHFLVGRVHYVVTGGGGAFLYGCAKKAAHLLRCIQSHEFLLLSISRDTIDVRAIDPDGAVIDSFAVRAP